MYILNEDREILNEIKKGINEFDELFIAVSYITDSGLKLLFEDCELKGKINVITTLDDEITTPNALRFLIENNANVNLINKENALRGFHSKFIVAKKGNKYFSIMGSFNITSESFENKFETAKFEMDQIALVNQYQTLIKYSKKLSLEDIEEYEPRFNEAEFISNENKLDSTIDENKMQIEALISLENLRKNGETKALAIAATGVGKTFLSAFDARNFIRENNLTDAKILFVVHNRQILKDAKKTFETLFGNKNKMIELFSFNKNRIKDSNFIFTTQKTMSNLISNNFIKKDLFDYVVIDEAHHIGLNKSGESNDYLKVVDFLKPKFLLGITATPFRMDGFSIYQSFDNNVALDFRITEALDAGLLSKYKYFSLSVSDEIKENGKWKVNKNNAEFFAKRFLNELNEKWSKVNNKTNYKKSLIFVSDKEGAIALEEHLNKLGNNAVAIYSGGEVRDLSIQEIINSIQNDDNSVETIIAIDMFNEGVDIPKLNVIAMLRPTESLNVFIQQFGRGLRKQPNKELLLLDFVGNYEKEFLSISAITDTRATSIRIISELLEQNPMINLNEVQAMDFIKKAYASRHTSVKTQANEALKEYRLINYKSESMEYPTMMEFDNFLTKQKYNFSVREIVQTFFSYQTFILDNLKIDKNDEVKTFERFFKLFGRMPITVFNTEDKKFILDLFVNHKTKMKPTEKLKELVCSELYINGYSDGFKKEEKENNHNEFVSLEKDTFKLNEIVMNNKLILEELKSLSEYIKNQISSEIDPVFDGLLRDELLYSNNYTKGIIGHDNTSQRRVGNTVINIVSLGKNKYKNRMNTRNEFIFEVQEKRTKDQIEKSIDYMIEEFNKGVEFKFYVNNYDYSEKSFGRQISRYLGEVKSIEKYNLFKDEEGKYRGEYKVTFTQPIEDRDLMLEMLLPQYINKETTKELFVEILEHINRIYTL